MPKKRGPQAAAPVVAEDELLLLQSQELAKEEAAKTKREMLSRFLKVRRGCRQHVCPCVPPSRWPPLHRSRSPEQDKLAKEQRSSALNVHKLHSQWRVVLREAKGTELHRDIEVLSQSFTQVVDCKDSVIEVSAGMVGLGREWRRGPPMTPLDGRSPWSQTWRRRRSSMRRPCAATCTTWTGCCSCSAAAWAA